MGLRFSALRILGGLFFILGGLAYYWGVTLGASGAILFVGAGVAVILLAAAGHRASAGDVAIFVVGLLVLAALVTPGIGQPSPGSPSRAYYMAQSSAIPQHEVDLVAKTDVGSISVSFSNSTTLGYEVNFTRSLFPFQIFSGLTSYSSVSNTTIGDVLVVNATARAYDISVTVGKGYVLDINASTGTGSVSVRSSAEQTLGWVYLQSGTGSVSGDLTSASIGETSLQTGTGSVSLSSEHLSPKGQGVPISLETGTGSVTLNVKLAAGVGVTLDASTAVGSVSHNLPGFTVSPDSSRTSLSATAGATGAASSFRMHLTSGTGGVTADAQFLPSP